MVTIDSQEKLTNTLNKDNIVDPLRRTA